MNTINNRQNTFNGISAFAKPLNTFYNPNAIIPTLIIESGVTAGRTAVASKRGGKMEATERFVEQGASAVIWLWGVQTLKKIGDKIGQKFLNLNLNFDVGSDYLRNPIKNNNISSKARNFKVANMLISTAIATYFIGFVLPKINHKISKRFNENIKSENNNQYEKLSKPVSFEEFKKQNKPQKNISFSSLASNTVALAHTLENNQTARLLITDSGVVAGRYHNSRNKYEKIESLFRDISSIYFYLFSTKHFVKLMNKLTNNTDINPKTLEVVQKELFKDNSKINANNLSEHMFGVVSAENNSKLNNLFTSNKKVISVDDFINTFPEMAEKAKNMAKLQPVFEGNGVLSLTQAQDVLRAGKLTSPEFLKEVMEKTTDGASSDKFRFVSAEKLDKIRASLDKFIAQIENYAKKQNVDIDSKLIEKVANSNIRKNFLFYSVGTGISIFVLSYLIPKVQYFITQKLTNEYKFPGAYNESK